MNVIHMNVKCVWKPNGHLLICFLCVLPVKTSHDVTLTVHWYLMYLKRHFHLISLFLNQMSLNLIGTVICHLKSNLVGYICLCFWKG